MKQRAPTFGRQFFHEEPLPDFPQLFQPLFVLRAEFLFEFFAQPLRERGTVSSGRDRDLQFAAPDHRAEIKVAVLGIIDHIA